MTSASAPRVPIARIMPLFLVSLAAVGFEIALTRYFAIANWSEYGYWVISITMVGFAVSGVVMSLGRDLFVRHAGWLMPAIPILLVLAAAFGWYFTTTNPFNPLQLQNRATAADELANIGLYYAVLFPFFFLAGFYISLNFLVYDADIGRVYGFDLAGAGLGAVFVLGLMFVLHPFYLLAGLLPFLAIAAVLAPGGRRWAVAALALVALVAAEVVVLRFNEAKFNEYKAIFTAINVPDSKTATTVYSPKGLYSLIDSFNERLDTDFSNNSERLDAAGPPRTFGLYVDGNRITSLAIQAERDTRYVKGTLDALPYALRPGASAMLIGTSGGFRLHELAAHGAGKVLALEPDEILRTAIVQGLGPAPPVDARLRASVSGFGPAAALAQHAGNYDVIDIAGDWLGQAEPNKLAFTVDAIRAYLGALTDNGMVSIPVNIREFTVYGVKMIATVRAALARSGIADPAQHVIIFRSAWNAWILVAKRPWRAEDIAAVRAFCDERSFDVSFYPGIDPAAARIYNDLPIVSFDNAAVTKTDTASDAIMDEAIAILSGRGTVGHGFFDLEPATYDRPFFHAVLKVANLGDVLERIEIVPREEIGFLINLAVIAQSIVLALLVLLLPVVKPAATRPPLATIFKSILYFAGLGIGFLFIEIYLIEKASFYLNDRTYAFALVLAAMLVFSGIGSMAANRFYEAPRRGIAIAFGVTAIWCVAAFFLLEPLLLATLTAPFLARVAIILVLIAPVSIALGLPFPLGLAQFRGRSSSFLPWAWSLNGAFSVISTPLANLIAMTTGLRILALIALALYFVVLLTFPLADKKPS